MVGLARGRGLRASLGGGATVEKFLLLGPVLSKAPQAAALSSSVTNGPLGLGGHQ